MYYNMFHFRKELPRIKILSSDVQMRIDGTGVIMRLETFVIGTDKTRYYIR